MFVKVHKPTSNSHNSGSSSTLFNYLNKEENEKDLSDRTSFFSHDRDHVAKFEAIHTIDNNNKNLSKKDYKFYMLTVNLSEKEQFFLTGGKSVKELNKGEKENYEDKLRGLTRKVMQDYADSFDKGLKASDLVYYGKIEYERHYKGNDQIVREKQAKSGALKQGEQTHIHIVVSRNNQEQNMKLSPLSKCYAEKENTHLKGNKVQQGFNHLQFKLESEQTFDKEFNYKRKETEKTSFNIQSFIEKQNSSYSSKQQALKEDFSPVKSFMQKYMEQDMATQIKSKMNEMNPLQQALNKEMKKIKQGLKYSSHEL